MYELNMPESKEEDIFDPLILDLIDNYSNWYVINRLGNKLTKTGVKNWYKETYKKEYKEERYNPGYVEFTIFFKNEEDAILFKLKWI